MKNLLLKALLICFTIACITGCKAEKTPTPAESSSSAGEEANTAESLSDADNKPADDSTLTPDDSVIGDLDNSSVSDDSADGQSIADESLVEADGTLVKFPSFTTYGLDGNVYTEDIFADKDITVINFWGTYCPPCIAEMPELGSWSREMPDNVQIIGIVIDVEDLDDKLQVDAANKILSGADADFLQLLPCYDMMDLLDEIYAIPTTIFVDRNGNIVGEAVVGAYVEVYKQTVSDYLGKLK